MDPGRTVYPPVPTSSGRVLIVESDRGTVHMARGCLVRAGYCVEVSPDGAQAMSWVERLWPDLVVLDPRLPSDRGTAFQRLRARTDVPVVMISPTADQHDRARGLQLGADDFLPNPLAPEELVARVRAVLRRAGGGPTEHVAASAAVPSHHLVAGALVLDRATRRVRVGGRWVALTALEFRLLAFLASHPGQPFGREELLERVWGYTIGDLSTVTVHVRRLREKIEPEAAHPVFIVTLWGVGYRFDPHVRGDGSQG